MSGTNPIFSGNSRFAADFQAVIDRSVAIASLSLNQLNTVRSGLSSQSGALSGLDTKFGGLQAAINALASTTGSSYSATASDPTIASLTIGTGVTAGTYTIEVTNMGAVTNTMSLGTLPKVTDPSATNISTATSFTLSVNGTNYTVTPTTNSLNALAAAINGAGAGVTATAVNVGSTAAPDYRLAIQGTQLNADAIQLSDGTNLLSQLSAGAPATYKVDGVAAQNSSRTITLAPGLTVNLLAQSATGVATTITVAQSTTGIQSALNAVINTYNAAVDEVDKQRGQSNGPLAGQSLLSTLNGTLHQIGAYTTGSGNITSATALGLTFDKNGKLSLDTATFSSLAVSDVLNFLGSATGGGFLKAATDAITGLEDTSSGALKTAISSVQAGLVSQDQLISQKQDSIDQLRQSLQAQMASADALIASLEQQASYMSSMFESMRIATQALKG